MKLPTTPTLAASMRRRLAAGLTHCDPERSQRAAHARRHPATPAVIAELCGLIRNRGLVSRTTLRQLRPYWSARYLDAVIAAAGERIVQNPGATWLALAPVVTSTPDR